MALPDPIPRREIILDVTSAAVDYEIPFPFIFDMDIEIAVSTAALPNTFSRLTYPTGYTLTGAGAPIGGAVHLAAAPQVGAKIRVRGISAENASENVIRGVRYNYVSIERSLLRLGWGLQEAVRDLSEIGNIVDGVRDAVEQTAANAETASAAAEEAAASAEAAKLWDPSSYSTTTQIAAMLANYAPSTRTIASGSGVQINGGASATLAATVTVSLDYATQAEAEAGAVAGKVMTPQRTAQAIAALAGALPGAVIQFSASGNYVPSPKAKYVLGILVGGGGGGGPKTAEGSSSSLYGGWGGIGGSGVFFYPVTPGASYPVVVGSGGAPAAYGGTTSIVIEGVSFSVSGGGPGGAAGAGGANGGPSGTCLFGGYPYGPMSVFGGGGYGWGGAGASGYYSGSGGAGTSGHLVILEFSS